MATIEEIREDIRLRRKVRQEETGRFVMKVVKFGVLPIFIIALIAALIPESESDKQIRDAHQWEALWADVPDGPTKADYMAMKAEARAAAEMAAD